MRDYGVVSPKFWIGETGKALRGDANSQLVALYLMTCPHANMIGVFHCPVLYISHETGIPFEGASKALARLSEGGFCTYDEPSETVFVHRMASYQVGESLKAEDNRVKSVIKEWLNVAVPSLQAAFFAIYSVAFHLPEPEKKGRASKAPSKPLRSQEQEQDKNKSKAPSGFDLFWDEYPNHTAKANAVKAWEKVPAELHSEIMTALSVQKHSAAWMKDNGQFVPHAATWLNGKRWEDQPTVVRSQADAFAGAL